MTNDRSRGAALAAPAADAEPPPREAWYDRLLNVFNLRPRDSLRTDIEEALAEPDTGEDAFSPLERAMLKNVLGLHKVRVDDVMLPRADIVAVASDTSLGDLLKLLVERCHLVSPSLPSEHEVFSPLRGCRGAHKPTPGDFRQTRKTCLAEDGFHGFHLHFLR